MMRIYKRERNRQNIISDKWYKKSLQHQVFPGSHPPKYKRGPTGLNFGDRKRTGILVCALFYTVFYNVS